MKLKAYKRLVGYGYLVAVFVGHVIIFTAGSRKLILFVCAKVNHSQTVSSLPLEPWVAVEKNGSVVCAHCTCTPTSAAHVSNPKALGVAIVVPKYPLLKFRSSSPFWLCSSAGIMSLSRSSSRVARSIFRMGFTDILRTSSLTRKCFSFFGMYAKTRRPS